MKINITIEIDDKELKGLLFGEEKPKEEVEPKNRWDIYYDRRVDVECVYDHILELATERGKLSVDAYVKFLNKSVWLWDDIPIHTNDIYVGWLLKDIQNARVVRYRHGYKLVLPEPVLIL